jgi:hypothetical protein
MSECVAFLGPSLPHAEAAAIAPGVDLRPPAAHGDVYAAAASGASTIVLVDGVFESVRPVWHKELLWALARGSRVIGASSMGALRAAECHAFGMEAVGAIAHEYLTGSRTSDGDVAVAHGDASTGWRPTSEALVNVEATLAAARADAIVSDETADRIADVASEIFYAERTWQTLLDRTRATSPDELDRLADWLPDGRVDQKAIDATAALVAIAEQPAVPARDWALSATIYWTAAEQLLVGAGTRASGDADGVLDELRLEPTTHREVVLQTRLRQLAARWSASAGARLDAEDTQHALDALRQRLGLTTAADVDAWRRREDIDQPAFRRLVELEAALLWAEPRCNADEVASQLTELRRTSNHGRLQARAAARAERLRRVGLDDDVSAAASSPEDAELLRHWLAASGLDQLDGDIEHVLDTHGYRDRPALLRALRRWWVDEVLTEDPPAR